ncbi:MAG: hypothetical protein FJW79_02620 [Actinobacteria bacterium]|nr:hypothetical protein [Actinomycetota bacterium]
MAAFRAWGRYALGATAAGAIGGVAFGLHRPVPVLDLFDLGMHELGHLLTALLPAGVMFLAGSVAQVAVPLALAAYFGFRRSEMASAGFCLAWAGTSARDVAVYVADAPVQALPLIGGGTHDWAYLLGPAQFDCLDRAGAIAGFIEAMGLAMVVGGLGVCLWPLASRRRAPRPGPVKRAATAGSALPDPRSAPGFDPAGDPWLAPASLPDDPARG